MKKLSFFQIILLWIFGALAVAGVLVFSFAIGNNSANTVGPISIWGTLDSAAFSPTIQSAAESNPIFKEVTYEAKDPTTYESDLTTALANGAGPDLFILRQDYILRDAGKITPVPPASMSMSQFQITFIDAANPYFFSGGALGIPLFVDPLVLYWNRDMLSSAGYVRPPVYWEELGGMAKTITKKNDTGKILKSLIAFGEYANVTNAKDILSVLIFQAGGTITSVDASGNLLPTLKTQGDAMQAAENALNFYTKFANPSKSEYTWNRSLPESRKAFAAGDVALYIGFASEGPLITQINPNLNMGVAAMPQIKIANRSINIAHVYGVAISRVGKNQMGALTIAANLASLQMGKDLAGKLHIPSALRDILAQPADGNADLYNKQAILARSWRDPDPEKTEVIFRDMIERVTAGSLSISDAVQKANEELGQALGQ